MIFLYYLMNCSTTWEICDLTVHSIFENKLISFLVLKRRGACVEKNHTPTSACAPYTNKGNFYYASKHILYLNS
jgi:hypothetical protein